MNLSDDVIQPGSSITVLGYPTISPDIGLAIKSQNPLSKDPELRIIPNPTITNGMIGKVIKGNVDIVAGGDQYLNPQGDLYQLTVNATGKGNSGGPVFNDRGEVIAIFSYMSERAGTSISFAVPIKYGKELMSNKSVIK